MAWNNQFPDFQATIAQNNCPRAKVPDESARVERTDSEIGRLAPGIWTNPIIGIIIGKGEPRNVPSKKDPNRDRYVVSFTLRDSPRDVINVQCWGGEQYMAELANGYHIGDVVEITQAAVQTKPIDGSDEKFRPSTPSPYHLSLSENKSQVKLYGGWSGDRYNQLMHVTTKPSNDFYAIADVMTNGQVLHGEHISIMAAVRSVGVVKDITTKTGKHIKRCEVKLFDETAPNFALVLWDEELVVLAQNWQPKDNVLFAADVRVTFDDFRKTMIATATAKTIITVNPDSREAYSLFQYAKSADLTELDGDFGGNSSDNIDLSTIQTIYTIAEVQERSTAGSPEAPSLDTGIVFAAVTSLNIDSQPERAVTTRCNRCRRRVDPTAGRCVNTDCPVGSNDAASMRMNPEEQDSSFSLQLSLSDHTGTLQNCSIKGNVASKMMNCSVEEYLALGEDMRTELKWNYLMERCKVYFKVLPRTFDWPQARVIVLSCERADLKEAVSALR